MMSYVEIIMAIGKNKKNRLIKDIIAIQEYDDSFISLWSDLKIGKNLLRQDSRYESGVF